jgi:hypothetical protein
MRGWPGCNSLTGLPRNNPAIRGLWRLHYTGSRRDVRITQGLTYGHMTQSGGPAQRRSLTQGHLI